MWTSMISDPNGSPRFFHIALFNMYSIWQKSRKNKYKIRENHIAEIYKTKNFNPR